MEQAQDLGVAGDLLADLAQECGLAVGVGVLDAAADDHPVRVDGGANALDRERGVVRGDQDGSDAFGGGIAALAFTLLR
ncbi:hypothetical protein GCM10009663_60460 [Kitasatospora arboriphila]|uniref:Uncharacterized protein n=1 Tax=Kitasatospora arboriphila TaxID=258052 RepID=A0ABP4ENW9_9ACTN